MPTHQISAQKIPLSTIGFIVTNGATTAQQVPAIAPLAGSITRCTLYVITSDGSTPLTFTIKQNGTPVFTASQTIAAGTAAGLQTIAALTANPLVVSAHDVFTLSITSGTSSWAFVAQLES